MRIRKPIIMDGCGKQFHGKGTAETIPSSTIHAYSVWNCAVRSEIIAESELLP